MEDHFDIEGLDVERLLIEWRWLCPQKMRLVARNALGDLFLADEPGRIWRLDVAVGKFEKVADSESEFIQLTTNPKIREQWFAEKDESTLAANGLTADKTHCIAFDVPLVFAESGWAAKPYVADIYEHVSFLGDLHRQISEVPDGGKVQFSFKPASHK